MKAPAGPGRRRAREVAFRVAYEADVLAEALDPEWRARCAAERLGPDPTALVGDVLAVLEQRGGEVDTLLREASRHWELERLAATDRSVLRIAAAELIARPGTPARVILDEAIEISRRFGSEESARFVNGVLDHVARSLRPAEV